MRRHRQLLGARVWKAFSSRSDTSHSAAVFLLFPASPLAHESKDKIRDVLSSILVGRSYGSLVKNPVEGIRIPPTNAVTKDQPHVTPEEFEQLVELIPDRTPRWFFWPCGQDSASAN